MLHPFVLNHCLYGDDVLKMQILIPVSLGSFVDKLNLSEDQNSSTLTILQQEGVTVEQLLSCITEEELEEIGICCEARSAIAAARQCPVSMLALSSFFSLSLLHKHREFATIPSSL
jgi:hypothetical protein